MSDPKVGKKYTAYHDGKVSPDRAVTVVIEDVVPIEELSMRYLKMWKRAITSDFNESLIYGGIHYCEGPQRFWDWNCEKFVFAHIEGDRRTEKDPMMFAKRGWGGWYAVNWNYMLETKERRKA